MTSTGYSRPMKRAACLLLLLTGNASFASFILIDAEIGDIVRLRTFHFLIASEKEKTLRHVFLGPISEYKCLEYCLVLLLLPACSSFLNCLNETLTFFFLLSL